MTSELARNGGKGHRLLSAIRHQMDTDEIAQLRPAEAAMVLEWAMDCSDAASKAELLKIFRATGGLRSIKGAVADLH